MWLWLYLSALLFSGYTTAKRKPKDEPEIHSIHVRSDIRYRFATTEMTSLVVNNKPYARIAVFKVILPEAAFISNFSMVSDGKEYPGQIQQIHDSSSEEEDEDNKFEGREVLPRSSTSFTASIKLQAHKQVMFKVRYQELLKRKLGYYEHIVYIIPHRPIKDVSIEVYITESNKIKFLQVPPLRSANPSIPVEDLANNTNVKILRPSSKLAKITFRPKPNGQVMDGIFVVKYSVEQNKKYTGEILSSNGYFVHYVIPEKLQPMKKDILFLLDTSSSMIGRKTEQLRSAMKLILNDLVGGERFNVLDFSHSLVFWRPRMTLWSEKSKNDCLKWINQRKIGGSTDINHAISEGAKMMKTLDNDQTSRPRAKVILFLTDGSATFGVSNRNTILNNLQKQNLTKTPIFSLSFGADADMKLLQRISLQNSGEVKRIYESNDSAIQLKTFYDQISSTLMTDVKVNYIPQEIDNGSLTNIEFNQYFNGSETIIAGKLTGQYTQPTSWNLEATTNSGKVNEAKKFERIRLDKSKKDFGFLTEREVESIPEKLWAHLNIKQNLDKYTIIADGHKKEKIAKRILDLSLKYNMVTPMTSMAIVKPEKEEAEETNGDAEGQQTAPDPLVPENLRSKPPKTRTSQIIPLAASFGDPHFLVRIKDLKLPICFDMPGKNQQYQNLVYDPTKKINITAKIVPGKGRFKPTRPLRTYIGEIFVSSPHMAVAVTPQEISFNNHVFTWNNETGVSSLTSTLAINGRGKYMEFGLSKGKKLLIKRNLDGKLSPDEGYLDFFVISGKGFSPEASGIIGRCLNMKAKLLQTYRNSIGITKATLKFSVAEQREAITVNATLRYRQGWMYTTIPCWKVDSKQLNFHIHTPQ
ncbi:inter-alpha-trypsin inhibitor heavy chain H3-like [Argonauta hians]